MLIGDSVHKSAVCGRENWEGLWEVSVHVRMNLYMKAKGEEKETAVSAFGLNQLKTVRVAKESFVFKNHTTVDE